MTLEYLEHVKEYTGLSKCNQFRNDELYIDHTEIASH